MFVSFVGCVQAAGALNNRVPPHFFYSASNEPCTHAHALRDSAHCCRRLCIRMYLSRLCFLLLSFAPFLFSPLRAKLKTDLSDLRVGKPGHRRKGTVHRPRQSGEQACLHAVFFGSVGGEAKTDSLVSRSFCAPSIRPLTRCVRVCGSQIYPPCIVQRCFFFFFSHN